MLWRVRDSGDIEIFVHQARGAKKPFEPQTREDVFQAIERFDRRLGEIFPSKELDFLSAGGREVCNRSSAFCNLYANNVLDRTESNMSYADIMLADLLKQGVLEVKQAYVEFDPKSLLIRSLKEEEEDAKLTEAEWRAKYVINEATYWELQKRRQGGEGISELATMQLEIYYCAAGLYKVDMGRINKGFSDEYCNEQDKERFLNFKR
jgi:hypothetical protein